MHFLEILREECGIVSAKNGCAPEGTCGCCLVLIDGRPALSCLRKPEQLQGHEVTTLEGIPDEMRRVLAEAFVLEGGVQCGFCIPGIVVRASSLLQNGQASSRESIEKALDGHLCRCTGYVRIVDAIQTAGEAWGGQDFYRRRCLGPAGHRNGLSRSAYFCRCWGNHLLRGRFSGDGGGGHAVPRTPSGESSEGRL